MKFVYSLILFLVLSTRLFAVTSQEYYAAGLQLYQKVLYDQAVTYLRAAVQTDPQNWRAFQLLGSAYYQQKNNSEAVATLKESLRLNPNNPGLQKFLTTIEPANPGLPLLSAAESPKKTKSSGTLSFSLGMGGDLPGSGWQTAYSTAPPCGEFSLALKVSPALSIGLDVDMAPFNGFNYVGRIQDIELRFLPTARYYFEMGQLHPYLLAGAGLDFEMFTVDGAVGESAMNPDLTAGFGFEFDLNGALDIFFQAKLNIIMTDPDIGMDLPLLFGFRFGL